MVRFTSLLLLVPVLLIGCPARAVRLNDVSGTTDDPLAESAFRQAVAHFEARRWDEAQQGFESFVGEFRGDPLVTDARLYLGRIALEKGELPRARQYFGELRGGSDQALAEQASFFDGLAVERSGDHRAAIEVLRPFAGRMVDPEDAELLYQTLADASSAIGDHVGALRWVDAVGQSATSEGRRRAALDRARAIIGGPLTREGAEQALQTLPRDGIAWPLVVLRRAKDALDTSDFAKATEMLALLRDSLGDDDPRVRELGDTIADRRNVDSYAIGAVLPLSGRAREIGAEVLRGLLTASESLQEGVPEGRRFRLVVRDDAGDPERAAGAVEDLVQTEHVIAIIGTVEGVTAEKAAQRAESYGVPILLLSPREGLTQLGSNVFRAYLTNQSEAAILASAASGPLAIRNIAVVYPDIPYGHALRDAFVNRISALGIRIAAEARYAPGTRNFTDTLAPLRNTQVQAIYLPCPAADVRLLAPALAAAGFWSTAQGSTVPAPAGTRATQLLLTSVGVDAETLRVAGRYLQGAVVSTSYQSSETGTPVPFTTAYTARFTRDPSFHAAFAHDAWQLIRATVERGARTRASLRDALSAVNDARGATSMRGFGEDREPLGPVRLDRVEGSRLVVLP